MTTSTEPTIRNPLNEEPIRVALLQLTSHPFVTVDTIDFASEPFRPENPADKGCLGRLLNHSLEVKLLRKTIRAEYDAWHLGRLFDAIEWLFKAEREWPNNKQPELIVLPEFSHSWEHVSSLQGLARKYKVAICAGSHGFETRARFPQNAPKHFDPETLKAFDERSRGTKSVIVEIDALGQLHKRLKWRLSPFEYTEARTSESSEDERPRLRHLQLRDGRILRVLTLVCSEALQHLPDTFISHEIDSTLASSEHHKIAPSLDLVVIPSYDFNPKSFEPILQHYCRNRVPVIYCNDGTSGGSCAQIIPDTRTGVWFWGSPLRGKLPKGDSIFVCDIVPHAAIDDKVANPRQTYAIVKLASLVADDPFNSPKIVAKQLRSLKERRRQDFDDELKLLSLLDRASPDPLQEEKIHHLIAQYGLSDYLDWWNILADDCVASNMISTEGNPVTLDSLERKFAGVCYDWIRGKLDGQDNNSDFGTALLAVREVCRSRFAKDQPDDPLSAIKHFNASAARDCKEQSMLRLHEMLGVLVERFRATSGWIFLLEKHEEQQNLVARVSHNSPITFTIALTIAQRDTTRSGIVQHVFATKRGYFTNNTENDPYYERLVDSTWSEICVPLIASGGDGNSEIIGVLNLESRNFDAFLPCHVGELQAVSSRLVPDLLLLREHYSSSGFTQWHPGRYGWGIRKVLNAFARTVATSILPSQTQEALSVTVWYHDSDKKTLFVIGTARFDFEYMNLRLLPEESWTGGVARAGRRHKSKPVTLAEAKRKGLSRDLTGEGHFHFIRSTKAERMEVELICSVPVFNASGDDSRPATNSSERSIGVLNLYFFQRERSIYGDVFVNQFKEPIVARLSQHLARLFNQVMRMRKVVAIATLRAALTESSITTVTDYVNARRFLSDCFEADGCSIFGVGRENTKRKLCPLSTTGLTSEGVPAGPDVYYDLDAPITNSVGFTNYLANNVGATYRRHDVADPDEIVAPGQPKLPSNLHPEDFAPTERDHRRFLGASYGSNNGLVGIVRLIRKPTDPFFLPEDQKLLQALGICLVPLLKNSLTASNKVETFWGESFLRKELDSGDAGGRRRVEQLIRRLCSMQIGPFGWNRKLVDAVLQTTIALAELATKSAVFLASIRILFPVSELASRGVAEAQALRLYAFHSKLSGQPPDEADEKPIVALNIGRAAISLDTAVYFVRAKCDRLFHGIHRDSEKVVAGINFPFTYNSEVLGMSPASSEIRGVLSVDASRELSEKEQKRIVSIAHVAANLLRFLGYDNSNPVRAGDAVGTVPTPSYKPRQATSVERRKHFKNLVSKDAVTIWSNAKLN